MFLKYSFKSIEVISNESLFVSNKWQINDAVDLLERMLPNIYNIHPFKAYKEFYLF